MLGVASLDCTPSPTPSPPADLFSTLQDTNLLVQIEGGGSARWAFADEDPNPVALVALATSSAVEPSRTGAAQEIHLHENKLFVQLGEKGEGGNTRWILDTGATNHMTSQRASFAELDTGVRGTVRFGDGSVVAIEGRGTIIFKCKNGEHRPLFGVYYIPKLTANIISLGQLDEDDHGVRIKKGILQIWDQRSRLLVMVKRSASRLYFLDIDFAQPVCLAARCTEVAWQWHARFGHLGFQSLRALSKGGMVRGLPPIDHVEQICDSCLAGKQRRRPFPMSSKYRASHLLELVHADLCGPITPETPGGKRSFLLVVDDKSRYMWVVLLASKDQAASAIIQLQARIEAEAGKKMGTLRTDRGGEFTARAFADYCAEQGIDRHLTAPYTPQQNGVVERRNQTVLGMARSMLKAKGMPGWLWGEAVITAVFILNRSLTRSVEGKTPYEVWYGVKPSVHFLRVFGCVAHVKVAGEHKKKLDDRRRAWDWRSVGDSSDLDNEPFHDDFTTVTVRHDDVTGPWQGSTMDTQSAARIDDVAAAAPGTPSTPMHTSSKVGVSATAGAPIQFVSPPTVDPDLDDNHDDAPLRFRTLATCLDRQTFLTWRSENSRCANEHGMYTRGAAATRVVVGVYVDDLIITGARQEDVETFKEQMRRMFRMSDLGPLSFYLGLEVKQGGDGIKLGQAAYARKLLVKAGMAACNPCHTPMEVRLKLSAKGSTPEVDAKMYRSLVGSLRYLVHTRPDIAYAVGYVSRFMETPRQEHLAAVKHILHYIAGTINYGLFYSKLGNTLTGYSDSDLGGDIDERRSTGGVIFFLGEMPVSWQSQKQKTVALSTCEAEYMAGALGACQAVWLVRLMGDITGVKVQPPVLKMDNQSAIALSRNPVLHDRSKHIDTKYHFIRECVENGRICVDHVSTEEQLADVLTKSLGRTRFSELRDKIGVVKL
ncbi:hypothetical protein MLD38_019168 [Melastoma candidum]|uniref:Uncharacterized protein n=1 Tax=Melastoma candidum TaxID=119954 RepID=A0ACB9QX92_9MYRT|nr:hypothetical protein MLD38_019168 [Melastoma candidum]